MPPSLSEIFKVFFQFGSTGFGGPLALIAMMERDCVAKRKWVTGQAFHESFVLCKMLPGPVAYQMALWVGYACRGTVGGLVAGTAFLIPGLALIFAISALYSQMTDLSSWQAPLQGMRVAAIVIILESLVRMLKPYYKKAETWIFGVVAIFMMRVLPSWEPLIILSCGMLAVLANRFRENRKLHSWGAAELLALFFVHFKAGAFVFGTGLAIIPFLEQEAVFHYHWLTHEAFLDGIAFGQITPGPVTITSAFIGYQVAGFIGGLVAAFGMYLPGIFFILVLLPKLKKWVAEKPWITSFQMGAISAVLGCLAYSFFGLAKVTLSGSVFSAVISLVLGIFLFALNWPSWSLIVLGAGIFILKTFIA